MAGEALDYADDEPLSEPEQVAAAVYAHFVMQHLGRLPLPSPYAPEDVFDVVHTVMNHTDLPPDTVADYVPEIRGFMWQLLEVFNQINDG